MLNIKLGEDYMIKSDSLNYILYKRHLSDPTHRFSKGEAKETWEAVGYFGKLKQLTDHLLELKVKESEVTSLQELRMEMMATSDYLVQLLEEIADEKAN